MMHRPYLSLPGSTRRQDDAQGSQSYERHLCLHKADCSLYRHRHKRALPITVCGRCFRQASGVLADDGLPALSLVLASTRCSGIGQRSQQYGHRCYVDRLIAGGQCLQRLVRICLSSAWGGDGFVVAVVSINAGTSCRNQQRRRSRDTCDVPSRPSWIGRHPNCRTRSP